MKALMALLLLALSQPSPDRVIAALRAAVAPALQQFPETDDSGAMPKSNNTEALWMVRPPEPGEHIIEVLANPLNEANQLKATRAMALIERNIEAAQRRAAAQYERAVSEAKRTGKSQDVDGVTLSDEGIEGAKIDAESHLTIEVLFSQPSYRFTIASAVEPQISPLQVPGVAMGVPANTYKDDLGERFAEAHTIVFLGRVARPAVDKTGDHSYEVSAASTPPSTPISSVVIHLRGNDVLMAEVLRKTDWNALLELMR
jgi:hypothetical protein